VLWRYFPRPYHVISPKITPTNITGNKNDHDKMPCAAKIAARINTASPSTNMVAKIIRYANV